MDACSRLRHAEERVRIQQLARTNKATLLTLKLNQWMQAEIFDWTLLRLVEKIKKSINKYNMINYYASVKVLCLDELGYVFPSRDQAGDIFQIISKRSELLPTIITTNLIPSQWGNMFEASTATAILDRLSLHGSFIAWEGPSYRGKK